MGLETWGLVLLLIVFLGNLIYFLVVRENNKINANKKLLCCGRTSEEIQEMKDMKNG